MIYTLTTGIFRSFCASVHKGSKTPKSQSEKPLRTQSTYPSLDATGLKKEKKKKDNTNTKHLQIIAYKKATACTTGGELFCKHVNYYNVC